MGLILKDEAYQIIGAAQEVHRELGNGFLESVYQEALAIELAEKKIFFEKEKRLNIQYKEHQLEKHYIADFICFNSILLEIKAAQAITDEHVSQTLNYLHATKLNLGIIINFGEKSLKFKRLVI